MSARTELHMAALLVDATVETLDTLPDVMVDTDEDIREPIVAGCLLQLVGEARSAIPEL